MGGNLYQRIEKECEAHIAAALKSLVGQSPDLTVFLSLVERCWQDLCDQMLMIRGIALYLDRTYVKQNPSVRSLWDMGLQLFRKHLSSNQEVEHKTVTGLLRMIDQERYFQALFFLKKLYFFFLYFPNQVLFIQIIKAKSLPYVLLSTVGFLLHFSLLMFFNCVKNNTQMFLASQINLCFVYSYAESATQT